VKVMKYVLADETYNYFDFYLFFFG